MTCPRLLLRSHAEQLPDQLVPVAGHRLTLPPHADRGEY